MLMHLFYCYVWSDLYLNLIQVLFEFVLKKLEKKRKGRLPSHLYSGLEAQQPTCFPRPAALPGPRHAFGLAQ
jgi:hypothetical protein